MMFVSHYEMRLVCVWNGLDYERMRFLSSVPSGAVPERKLLLARYYALHFIATFGGGIITSLCFNQFRRVAIRL